MYELLKALFPLNRSLTGEGVRKTFDIIKNYIDNLRVHSVPSGEKVFDWIVPNEWNISEAYILKPDGEKICDYNKNNLHLLGYSIPIKKTIKLEQLQNHLHSLPELPDAIPYITSYYNKNWGFCISENERLKLLPGNYKVVIKGTLKPGNLNYGDVFIPSTQGTEKEVFFSTYICHPSMANNELSGPVIAVYLIKWLTSLKSRYYNYRFVFAPETIGSLIYLKFHLKKLKENVIAGFNLTCLGDDNNFSFVPSRSGDTLADHLALHMLKHNPKPFKKYPFLSRGSDERQYCSPGVDLPFVTICRSKYHEYKEYHTSLDDLNFISENGLNGSFAIFKNIIRSLEINFIYKSKVIGEPFLSDRNLYSSLGFRDNSEFSDLILNTLTYCDGTRNLLEIVEKINVSILELMPIVKILKKENLI